MREEETEDWDDDLQEHEWPEEDDDDEEEPTVPCPYCSALIHEEAQQCPECGEYISEEQRPAVRPPWWIVAGIVAALYAVYHWIAG
jgi:predicted nucleic acid-binding Zn ribbon protein